CPAHQTAHSSLAHPGPAAHPRLPSFPTRRSSDLADLEDSSAPTPNAATRSAREQAVGAGRSRAPEHAPALRRRGSTRRGSRTILDRKSTRLNSSHVKISYAVFCLKKKTQTICNRN